MKEKKNPKTIAIALILVAAIVFTVSAIADVNDVHEVVVDTETDELSLVVTPASNLADELAAEEIAAVDESRSVDVPSVEEVGLPVPDNTVYDNSNIEGETNVDKHFVDLVPENFRNTTLEMVMKFLDGDYVTDAPVMAHGIPCENMGDALCGLYVVFNNAGYKDADFVVSNIERYLNGDDVPEIDSFITSLGAQCVEYQYYGNVIPCT